MPKLCDEFILSQVFENVSILKNDDYVESEKEEHSNVNWKIRFSRLDDNVYVYLLCIPPPGATVSSVETENKLKMISANGKNKTESFKQSFDSVNGEYKGFGRCFMKWEEMEKEYSINGKLTVEAYVKVLKMKGIPKKKLRNFDETMKECSDIILIAEDEKFYVSKLFLSSHSTYFKSLLLGNSNESKKSEVVLTNIKSADFQNFLEVLHGELAIDDETVEGILKLANMYDAPTAHRRCEEFLMKESDKKLKEMFEMVPKYNLQRLKKKCLAEIKTVADIREILPGNLEEMDKSVMAAILQKSMALHQ